MSFKKLLILTCSTLLISSAPAFAKKGTESGGGGDASELRVNEIRSDLLNWISNEGAKGLDLPNELSYGEYFSKMTDILQSKKVIIGFVEKDDKNKNELKVSVNGTPKTCRGFISAVDSKPHILCNLSRFKSTSESEQYKLIHHEFAGLVNVENNEGAASDYAISSQITDFLSEQTVLKLAVKKSGNQVESKQKPICTIHKTHGSNFAGLKYDIFVVMVKDDSYDYGDYENRKEADARMEELRKLGVCL
jgi:hypothetical protein